MALFKDTEKRKVNNYKKTQSVASLRAVNNYISRDDKIGKIENIVVNKSNEEATIEKLLNKRDNAVFNYVTQNKKTEQKLVTGINCRPSSAFDEMMLTKNLYNKTHGRQFKHFVHSYSKDEKNLTPEMAHEISLKLLEHEKFKDFQILVATHTDTDHFHTHIVINSVNMANGKKWNHSLGDLIEITDLSNKLCREYGLEYSFVDNRNSKFKNKEKYSEEYKAKEKGRSWKHEAWLTINESRKISTSKENFIENLEKLNYKVRWEDSRKNITFTLPNGRKLNNDKLHPVENFTKEALLKQFEKNRGFIKKNQEFKEKVKSETLQELYFKTINFLFENPDQGDKDYPLTYLEGQALKEKMIENAKGRGFDWEDDQVR